MCVSMAVDACMCEHWRCMDVPHGPHPRLSSPLPHDACTRCMHTMHAHDACTRCVHTTHTMHAHAQARRCTRRMRHGRHGMDACTSWCADARARSARAAPCSPPAPASSAPPCHAAAPTAAVARSYLPRRDRPRLARRPRSHPRHPPTRCRPCECEDGQYIKVRPACP